MKALVTGGAGFIGSHLTRKLLKNGYEVRVIDNLNPQIHGASDAAKRLPPEVEFIKGDVRDADSVSKALEGVDFIFHFAAHTGVGQSMYQMKEYMDCNVIGTSQLLEALAANKDSVQRLVVASSRAVYGEGKYVCPTCGTVYPPPRTTERMDRGEWEVTCPICGRNVAPVPTDEEKPLQPGSVYAISKRDEEDLALCAAQAYGIPVTVLRFFNVYGSGQSLNNPYTGIITIFASKIRNGEQPLIYEDGLESRDFVHVDDIASACVLAIRSEKADCARINVGSGRALSVLEMAQTMIKTMGADLTPKVIGKYRVGDIRHCHADLDKARALLGYEPRISFDKGIREFLDWAQDEKYEDRLDIATNELKQRGLFR